VDVVDVEVTEVAVEEIAVAEVVADVAMESVVAVAMENIVVVEMENAVDVATESVVAVVMENIVVVEMANAVDVVVAEVSKLLLKVVLMKSLELTTKSREPKEQVVVVTERVIPNTDLLVKLARKLIHTTAFPELVLEGEMLRRVATEKATGVMKRNHFLKVKSQLLTLLLQLRKPKRDLKERDAKEEKRLLRKLRVRKKKVSPSKTT
jgi:hypothetical protein